MATATALMTLEEYASLPDLGIQTELIRGRIVEVTRPGFEHGLICAEIAFLLTGVVKQTGSGRVIINDSGVITQREPDTLRGPDVAYYSGDKVSRIGWEKRYPQIAPDLVVEVRSPTDRWTEIMEKTAEYLTAGVLVVVVLDPEPRSAHVFKPDSPPVALGPDDTLAIPGLLGDFAVRVGAIFE